MDELNQMKKLIEDTIGDDPPFSVREGGMIKPGFSPEVDRLRSLTENAKGEVAAIEASERERTGIKKLKVGYNKVFGYYIEMPRSQSDEVPANYIKSRPWLITNALLLRSLRSLSPSC
jgi:DNA mismatch repair protein MutS